MKVADNYNEKSLIEQIKAGDYQAFKVLFDLHYTYMVKTAFHFLPDQDTCKDIVQDVFFEFWKKREQIVIHTSLKAYLRQSVVNKSLNFIKSRKRFQWEEEADSIHIPSNESSAIQTMEASDLQFSINKAIDELPEKCRLVFLLNRMEDMSHKEISEQLDISVKTIENHMTKALKLLKASLVKSGYYSLLVLWLHFLFKI